VSSNAALFEKAKALIETEIRPLIQSDGGDIEVVELSSDNILKVNLQGACVNCASSAMTLSFGIEARLKELLPELQGVEQVVPLA
jgi:Fe-S cluster biogenesis protein NfuA